MTITVHCPKGHRLIASETNAGKTGRCPVCRAMVSIPMPRTEFLSESAIMSILGDPEPTTITEGVGELSGMASVGTATSVAEEAKPKVRSKTKLCPSCDREIDTGYHICPHCQTYISSLRDF